MINMKSLKSLIFEEEPEVKETDVPKPASPNSFPPITKLNISPPTVAPVLQMKSNIGEEINEVMAKINDSIRGNHLVPGHHKVLELFQASLANLQKYIPSEDVRVAAAIDQIKAAGFTKEDLLAAYGQLTINLESEYKIFQTMLSQKTSVDVDQRQSEIGQINQKIIEARVNIDNWEKEQRDLSASITDSKIQLSQRESNFQLAGGRIQNEIESMKGLITNAK